MTLPRIRKLSCWRLLFGVLVASCCFSVVPDASAQAQKTIGQIVRLDPKLDDLIAKDQTIEVLAEGFEWSEGPVWIPDDEQHLDGGYLLFCDIPNNRIVKYQPGREVSVYLEPSGYTGSEAFTGAEPGTNGLTLDAQGRLVMCAHGDRCIKRMDKDGTITVLVDRYEGKRLNSPNDLVFHPSGALYFTDPPYGLPERENDPGRELDFFGVYRWKDDKLTLLTREMTRPNGIAFSPDYQTLYVAQSDPRAAIWKSFSVQDDGSLGAGKLFYDATKDVNKLPGLPDGMCVDVDGNVWATGPGGVYVFTPQGQLLGRISTGERTANCTFGDDGSTLYITADMFLCKVQTKTRGLGFAADRTN